MTFLQVPALEHKKTLIFINRFIIKSTQFLNRFSTVCEQVSRNFLGYNYSIWVCVWSFINFSSFSVSQSSPHVFNVWTFLSTFWRLNCPQSLTLILYRPLLNISLLMLLQPLEPLQLLKMLHLPRLDHPLPRHSLLLPRVLRTNLHHLLSHSQVSV